MRPAASPSASARKGDASTSPMSASNRSRWTCADCAWQVVQLPHQGQRKVEVVATERPKLDAGRPGDREAADRALGIAERHRPVKSGVRFSRKAAIPSFWSSLAKSR